jgi:hypothetical protein
MLASCLIIPTVCCPALLLPLLPVLQLIQRAANAQHSQSLKAALLQHVQHDLAAAGPHVGLQELDAAIQLLQVSLAVAVGDCQGVARRPIHALEGWGSPGVGPSLGCACPSL